MTELKKFSAPHSDIRVALLNGQATTITKEPKELPECFWGPAYALGAISGDMEKSSEADKAAKIKEAIEADIAKNQSELVSCLEDIFKEPGSFIGQDKTPIARKVSARLGRSVTKPEVMKVWDLIVGNS